MHLLSGDPTLSLGSSTVWSSGDQCCNSSETVSHTSVPQLSVVYTLSSTYDEDVCAPMGS